MRRLARRLFTLCSAVSLVPCVVAAGFWISSYRTTVMLSGDRPPYRVTLGSSDGVVRLCVGNSTGETWPAEFVNPPGWTVGTWATPDRSSGSIWEELPSGLPGRLGFHVEGDKFVNGATTFGRVIYRTGDRLYLPHWCLVAVLALPPAVAIRRASQRRRRLRLGLCPSCGYDLRASPGRCPECGAAAAC